MPISRAAPASFELSGNAAVVDRPVLRFKEEILAK